ncbi:class I SAM-dependent methyltransferase [Longimicrobium sp.]|uniref:class I SAM-dependent methyltransferase n=1 Tax=Longimicrobium sp. TaxID=2029185 RepID=UPI002C791931|nr:methyltransferase domain-containing protein [Longimicrobium sp.]HSU16116.1 methyltransferase domain-containing protein [Longimicrobium sp.]
MTSPAPVAYDAIGTTYVRHRRPDPRIAAAVAEALGDAASVVNVGAGAGAYEPDDRPVAAAEPSAVMLAQRARGAAPAVQARAEALPFADSSAGAVMAVLTIHHWADAARGLAECARVARDRVVLLTFDPESAGFWLVQDYFPAIHELDARTMPTLPAIASVLGEIEVRPVPIPADCADGFLGAYWRRPAAYLDPEVRAGISVFARIGGLEPALGRLRGDLASGAWHARHGHLLERGELDIGYRIVISRIC